LTLPVFYGGLGNCRWWFSERQLPDSEAMWAYDKLSQIRSFLPFGSAGGGALPVAFAVHFDDRRVMDQAVHRRRCHGGILD
jgi:hypothetical protein